jgi:hypothetical protein
MLSALRAITKVKYRTDLQRNMLMTCNRPGVARIVKVYDHFCTRVHNKNVGEGGIFDSMGKLISFFTRVEYLGTIIFW